LLLVSLLIVYAEQKDNFITSALKRIYQYEGIYGERVKPDPEYLFSELLETRSCNFDWDIKPHIHPRLYQLFYIKKGKLDFYEAANHFKLEGPSLILVAPTALHGFTYAAEASGRILTMSDTLVDTLFSGLGMLTPMLNGVQHISAFTSHYSPEKVDELMAGINEELFSSEPGKRTMLRACLQQLFIVIYRLWQHNQSKETAADDMSLTHFRRFRQLILRAGATQTVAQMAQELGITPVHLNRICRQIVGRSAGQLIQEYLLEEARKYLTYTSYSVSEIAYLLHFEYPNYFARFFRKHTGLSPTQFREKEKR